MRGVCFTLLLYIRRKSQYIHWIGGWADPSAGLDVVAKRRNSITRSVSSRVAKKGNNNTFSVNGMTNEL
jgi:hypothetical protein